MKESDYKANEKKGVVTMLRATVSLTLILVLTAGWVGITAVVGEAAIDEDVVLAMPFDTEDAKDISSLEHTGVLEGDVKLVEGKFRKALSFDGDGDKVVVESKDDALDIVDSNATIVMWAKFANSGVKFDAFCAKNEGGGEKPKWVFYNRPDDNARPGLTFHINSADHDPLWFGKVPFVGDKGKWYQIAVVVEGHDYRFYVDGKNVGEESDATKEKISLVELAPLTIGWSEGNFFFNGVLDEFLMVKRALTEEELGSHFDGGIEGFLAVQPRGKLSAVWGNIKA